MILVLDAKEGYTGIYIYIYICFFTKTCFAKSNAFEGTKVPLSRESRQVPSPGGPTIPRPLPASSNTTCGWAGTGC